MSKASLVTDSIDAGRPCGLRDVETRRRLLDGTRVHVLPLEFYIHSIRGESEYRISGQGGAILMNTPELRVVIEALEPGERLTPRGMRGPATLYVLDGELELATPADSFRALAREVVVLPRAEERSIQAVRASSFLLALAPEAHDA